MLQLSDDEALSLITINPAIHLGIDQYVGSIEEGKDGDIAIFKNHPLSIYAIPMVTIVDGVVRFNRENDPDDMRIYPDPEAKIDVTIWLEEDHDRCMANTEFLFTEK